MFGPAPPADSIAALVLELAPLVFQHPLCPGTEGDVTTGDIKKDQHLRKDRYVKKDLHLKKRLDYYMHGPTCYVLEISCPEIQNFYYIFFIVWKKTH